MMITMMLVEHSSSTIPCSCLCILFIMSIVIYVVSDIFISYCFVYNFNIYFCTNHLLSMVFSGVKKKLLKSQMRHHDSVTGSPTSFPTALLFSFDFHTHPTQIFNSTIAFILNLGRPCTL